MTESNLSLLTANLSSDDARLVERAYEYAQRAHGSQKRFSGEPYFNHVSATARRLAELNMDAATIAAGLLHDVCEDTGVPREEIEREFSAEIAFLVDGVTKLGAYKYSGATRHAESLRKFLIALSHDMRVLVIRFADRLHNMQTLQHVRPEKQLRIALETLEIYAPLANRLGMGQIQGELEDLAFPYVYPEEYQNVSKLHAEQSTGAAERVDRVRRLLEEALAEESITAVALEHRIKHLYSLYRKLKRHDYDIEKVYDIAALRVIVPTLGDCYRVLGIIHGLWTPLPGRVKDYIAAPKPNGYQSLHTTIFAGEGEIVEIQIRTEAMHEEAEYGVAAHLSYKEGIARATGQPLARNLDWLQELIEWQKNISESEEFLEHLKMDFFRDRVFVFTPAGDVVDLPEDSCPLDLAYAIHSDIGDKAVGAKVNGKLVSFDTKLKNGDIVEITTKRSAMPSLKWLDYTKTALARKHIKAAAKRE